MLKGPHVAALGLLMTSVSAQIGTLADWSGASKPVFIAAVLSSIGATLIALFSDKPRDPNAKSREGDQDNG